MKKVLATLGGLSLGSGIYLLYTGHPFMDQISLFISGAILLGYVFINHEKPSCKIKN